MTLHQTLTDKLFDYLLPVCIEAGVPDIIFDYDNGVKLNGSFVAIDIRNIIADGKPEVEYKTLFGTNNNEEFVNYRGTVDFAIDVYSNDQAIFIAEQIKVGLARERSHEMAMKLNLGFVSYGDTANLSAVEKGKYKHRGQFTMLVNYAIVHTIVDTTIGSVPVLGNDTDGKLIIDETISEDGIIS